MAPRRNTLLDLLRCRCKQGVAVLDNGLGSECRSLGADISNRLWSASLLLEPRGRAIIHAAHTNALRAGADIVTTASYQGSRVGLMEYAHLSAAQADDVLLDSVAIARRAVDDLCSADGAVAGNPPPEDLPAAAHPRHGIGRQRPLVAASIGPYGAYLADGSEYRGDYALSEADLVAFHGPKYDLLRRSGADCIAFETIPCVREARAIAALLRDTHRAAQMGPDVVEDAEVPCWVSFSCRGPAELRSGEPIVDAVTSLVAQLPDSDVTSPLFAIGVNCTAPEHVTPLLGAIRGVTSRPLVCYPNSGEGWDPVARSWLPGTRWDFRSSAREWVDAGARLIGGCCRTTAADIADIAAGARGEHVGAAGRECDVGHAYVVADESRR